MSEWQPIETAPKDGTVIAVWNPQQPDLVRYARFGHFTLNHREWLTLRGTAMTWVPTHWIELPDPPTT